MKIIDNEERFSFLFRNKNNIASNRNAFSSVTSANANSGNSNIVAIATSAKTRRPYCSTTTGLLFDSFGSSAVTITANGTFDTSHSKNSYKKDHEL